MINNLFRQQLLRVQSQIQCWAFQHTGVAATAVVCPAKTTINIGSEQQQQKQKDEGKIRRKHNHTSYAAMLLRMENEKNKNVYKYSTQNTYQININNLWPSSSLCGCILVCCGAVWNTWKNKHSRYIHILLKYRVNKKNNVYIIFYVMAHQLVYI